MIELYTHSEPLNSARFADITSLLAERFIVLEGGARHLNVSQGLHYCRRGNRVRRILEMLRNAKISVILGWVFAINRFTVSR